ncbi:hypothetical protein LJR235_004176 [Pararhizobium sp. LjRoot235]
MGDIASAVVYRPATSAADGMYSPNIFGKGFGICDQDIVMSIVF